MPLFLLGSDISGNLCVESEVLSYTCEMKVVSISNHNIMFGIEAACFQSRHMYYPFLYLVELVRSMDTILEQDHDLDTNNLIYMYIVLYALQHSILK